jgi:hypothetical protein
MKPPESRYRRPASWNQANTGTHPKGEYNEMANVLATAQQYAHMKKIAFLRL